MRLKLYSTNLASISLNAVNALAILRTGLKVDKLGRERGA